MNRQLRCGTGWRLGWNPEAAEFKGLVGGEAWAIELTGPEFRHFCSLLDQLVQTMNQMADELMEEEAITCEAASDLVWMEASGYPQSFSINLILLRGRRGEGQWPAGVVPELIQAAQVIEVF